MSASEAAKTLFDAGDLSGAIEAATADVRSHATDVQRRLFLAELFCFQGDIERADNQLDVIVRQHPDSVLVLQFRQLLRAEKHREECRAGGRPPEFLSDPPEHLRLLLRACMWWREGDAESARAAVEEADSVRPELSGSCDSIPFTGLRDLEDISASFFEVLTSKGTYYWVPFETVDHIEFHAPVAPRDLIWRRASLTVHDGPDGEVFLPALYFDSSKSSDESLRLGRSTDWIDDGGPVRGVGQRVYLVGEQDRSVLEIQSIDIECGRVRKSLV